MRTEARKLARAQGSLVYFTGEPCKHGHVGERRVSNGHCLECEKVQEEKRRIKRRPQKREWRLQNLEACKKRENDYANSERGRAVRAKYRWDNPDKMRGYWKTQRENDPEKTRERTRISEHNRRAVEGCFDRGHLLLMKVAQEQCCFWCETDIGREYHIDHYVPLSRCGTNWPNNIVLACRTCNLKRRNKLALEFAAWRAAMGI